MYVHVYVVPVCMYVWNKSGKPNVNARRVLLSPNLRQLSLTPRLCCVRNISFFKIKNAFVLSHRFCVSKFSNPQVSGCLLGSLPSSLSLYLLLHIVHTIARPRRPQRPTQWLKAVRVQRQRPPLRCFRGRATSKQISTISAKGLPTTSRRRWSICFKLHKQCSPQWHAHFCYKPKFATASDFLRQSWKITATQCSCSWHQRCWPLCTLLSLVLLQKQRHSKTMRHVCNRLNAWTCAPDCVRTGSKKPSILTNAFVVRLLSWGPW